MKFTIELSTCCDMPVEHGHCDKCKLPCTTWEHSEEYYDEIKADDGRGLKDEQIKHSLNELT